MKGALNGRIWTQPVVFLPYQATEVKRLASRGRKRWHEELWSGLHGCKGGLNIFESLPQRPPPSNPEIDVDGRPSVIGQASPSAPKKEKRETRRSSAGPGVLDILSGSGNSQRKSVKHHGHHGHHGGPKKSTIKHDGHPLVLDDLPVAEDDSSESGSDSDCSSSESDDFEPPVGIQKECFQVTAFKQCGRRVKRTWNQRIWDLNAKLHRTQKMAILWAQETQRHLQEVADKALVKNCLLCWMKYTAAEITARHEQEKRANRVTTSAKDKKAQRSLSKKRLGTMDLENSEGSLRASLQARRGETRNSCVNVLMGF